MTTRCLIGTGPSGASGDIAPSPPLPPGASGPASPASCDPHAAASKNTSEHPLMDALRPSNALAREVTIRYRTMVNLVERWSTVTSVYVACTGGAHDRVRRSA